MSKLPTEVIACDDASHINNQDYVESIYKLACDLDLERLRLAAVPEMVRKHSLLNGPELVAQIGLAQAKYIVRGGQFPDERRSQT